MKRKRHWTVYATIAVALTTAGCFLYFWFLGKKHAELERAVNEAGGVVHWVSLWEIGFPPWDPFPAKIGMVEPVAVEISSGSHPIPDELSYIKSLRSIRRLSLNTNIAGDHLVPLISTFKHLEILDLTGTDFTATAALNILDALPDLKEIHLSENTELESRLIPNRHHSRIQIHSDPDF